MPRIRTLKPEAPQHRKVGRLSIWARWLWAVMITQADDEGRLVADTGQLKTWAFAYDVEITLDQVERWLQEVAQTCLVRLYTVRAVRYAYFPSWRDHQKIDRPTQSKLPIPPQLRSTRTRRAITETSPSARHGSDLDLIGSRIKDLDLDRKGGERGGKPEPMSLDQSNSGHDPSHYHTALEVLQAVEAGHITQDQGSARLRELGKGRGR